MAKEPGERMATAGELLASIKAVQAELQAPAPVPVRGSTASAALQAAQVTTSRPQRNWLSLFGAMMGVTAVAVATAWLLLMH